MYNGHHCWNCWNVSLWIANTEDTYRLALECKRRAKNLDEAVELFLSSGRWTETPDGAEYTADSIRRALADLE